MRIVIAGVHSGVGKTTISAGLAGALRARGLTVQPFKVGPDYIDPTYLSAAAGRTCRNLDSWMVSPERIPDLLGRAARGADIALIEGVMGLFDGLDYEGERGSTAQIAKLTQSPVIVILDAGAMARSAGAMALGYQRFDPDLNVAGFILNRMAGEGHAAGVTHAVERATGLPVIGWLPRSAQVSLPERHLGLIPTAERNGWQEQLDAAAELARQHIDLDRLLAIAGSAPQIPLRDPFDGLARVDEPGEAPLIAVARDEAFNFIYEDNLELLQAAGARLAFFSPLRDSHLPAGTNGVILSGGFPEVFAAQLAANDGMRQSLRAAHTQGLPIYAECGGLMALTESIRDLDGNEHSLFGLLPGRSVMTRRLTLGYRAARAASDSWLMARGTLLNGHEFHYSVWEDHPPELAAAYDLLPLHEREGQRPEGALLGGLFASYVHLFFWNQPELALNFVRACRAARLLQGAR